ncbi:hypothetical protein DJ533_18095 [Acinetobacter defluvii]|uniref:CMP-N-acetylneuraminate-beta-galactosamide-alpha-2, 3-sialyltransferase n=1 Tax=Acinetobacter defluvii TaxID=1871111 RepID=A0A2S2FHE6_9GAMM|nr:glycosyltransferase family 52 [Acinetobacter defluvii]AWL30330.1 hypothetical protein DJ533_18095 [Acinetobacter defluvii]
MSMKNKNLLICLTPLQMMIASKIIDDNPGIYDVLCFSYNDNEKYNHYFTKISEKCDISYRYIVESQGKIRRIFEFAKYRLFINRITKINYDTVFLASVDNPFFHLLLSLLKKNEIHTFDDGTANIYKKSTYYVFPKKSVLQYGILRFLGNTYHTQKVIDASVLHHTIYEGFENITQPLKPVKLMDLNIETIPNKSIKIYLGQPLEDLNFKNEDKIFKFLKEHAVDHYLPHPREKKQYDGFTYIHTPLIFEDYVVELLISGYSVEVYTLLSTAVLNVEHKNLTVYITIFPEIKGKYLGVYNLFNEKGFVFLEKGAF